MSFSNFFFKPDTLPRGHREHAGQSLCFPALFMRLFSEGAFMGAFVGLWHQILLFLLAALRTPVNQQCE